MQTISIRNPEVIAGVGASQLDPVFVRSQSVVARRVAGETLIVPIRGKVGDLASIYSFNETGSLIWQSLESPKGAADLAAAVALEYEVEPEQAERDVQQFLSEMLQVGLVEERPRYES